MRILTTKPARHPLTPVKIAIVTGLSNPSSCELSRGQRELLQSLDAPEDWKVYRNFPFVDDPNFNSSNQDKPVGLLSASLANGWQFATSHFQNHRRLAAPHWDSLFRSARHVLLLTGSCGVQLVTAIEKDQTAQTKIEILSFGPVAFRKPGCQTTTVQGSRDFVSRVFFRSVDQTIAGLGHMDYWYNAEVKEATANWLSNKISELSAQGAISPPKN